MKEEKDTGSLYRMTRELLGSNKGSTPQQLLKGGRLVQKPEMIAKHFMLPATSLPMPRICSAFQNLPIEIFFLKFSQHGLLYGINYPSVRIPKLWSLEDLGLRNIHKLEAFKSELYSRLVEGYSKEVTCDNPFCEDCN